MSIPGIEMQNVVSLCVSVCVCCLRQVADFENNYVHFTYALIKIRRDLSLCATFTPQWPRCGAVRCGVCVRQCLVPSYSLHIYNQIVCRFIRSNYVCLRLQSHSHSNRSILFINNQIKLNERSFCFSNIIHSIRIHARFRLGVRRHVCVCVTATQILVGSSKIGEKFLLWWIQEFHEIAVLGHNSRERMWRGWVERSARRFVIKRVRFHFIICMSLELMMMTMMPCECDERNKNSSVSCAIDHFLQVASARAH